MEMGCLFKLAPEGYIAGGEYDPSAYVVTIDFVTIATQVMHLILAI